MRAITLGVKTKKSLCREAEALAYYACKGLEAITDGSASTPAEVAHAAALRNEETVGGTSVDGDHQGEAEAIFDTDLAANAKTETVVAAVVEVETRTNIPVQIVNNVEAPVVSTCQVEFHVVATKVADTKVELETVAAKTFLIGKFSTVTSTTTKTDTDSVLSVSSKTQSYNSYKKYEKFLHNELNFKFLLIILLTKSNCKVTYLYWIDQIFLWFLTFWIGSWGGDGVY